MFEKATPPTLLLSLFVDLVDSAGGILRAPDMHRLHLLLKLAIVSSALVAAEQGLVLALSILSVCPAQLAGSPTRLPPSLAAITRTNRCKFCPFLDSSLRVLLAGPQWLPEFASTS